TTAANAVVLEPFAALPHAVIVDARAHALGEAAVRLDVDASNVDRHFMITGREGSAVIAVLAWISCRPESLEHHRKIGRGDVDVDVHHRPQLRPDIEPI